MARGEMQDKPFHLPAKVPPAPLFFAIVRMQQGVLGGGLYGSAIRTRAQTAFAGEPSLDTLLVELVLALQRRAVRQRLKADAAHFGMASFRHVGFGFVAT